MQYYRPKSLKVSYCQTTFFEIFLPIISAHFSLGGKSQADREVRSQPVRQVFLQDNIYALSTDGVKRKKQH